MREPAIRGGSAAPERWNGVGTEGEPARTGGVTRRRLSVTAPARLLALRLQGFKSFGERTLVEFGPGISAVVGPNGSGKSNLAMRSVGSR